MSNDAMSNDSQPFATVYTACGTVEIGIKLSRLPLVFLDDLAMDPEGWRKVAAAICAAADYVEGHVARHKER